MSSSREAREKDPLRFWCKPELNRPSLIIGWSVDAGRLGTRVINYLNRKLDGRIFCEIEPADFFPLGGVSIEDDLVQFPESKFYASDVDNLVLFKSAPPNYAWHEFLNLVLDAAERWQVKEIYSLGGMVSPGAHTAPRELVGIFNSPELKVALGQYNLNADLDYETPAGQRPTLNSFLLWAASRRNIAAVNLWVPVPFYLVPMDDPRAQKRVLEFFNRRFDLKLDFTDLDADISRQNEELAEVRSRVPDVDEFIKRLESNLALSTEENQKLATEVENFFREKKT
ncbi:MAG: PAC2 family protein [Chloroflexota bacterium]|nr:PAC2 family protein [Chloroflexota bacterium]